MSSGATGRSSSCGTVSDPAGLRALCKPDGVLYDVKYLLPADKVDGRL